jgi:hypothetical protein
MIMANADASNAMTVKFILAWCFVGIPLAWGVLQTIANAMSLFR